MKLDYYENGTIYLLVGTIQRKTWFYFYLIESFTIQECLH